MKLMNLDEAVEHCLEVANNGLACADCAAEHAKLASWLTELKAYRAKFGPLKAKQAER